MFDQRRDHQFKEYNRARTILVNDTSVLIALEKYFADLLRETISNAIDEIVRDFNEASYLFPFWQNYPPDERGRQPKGDQFPWIEVGEHAVGSKLGRLLARDGIELLDVGLPAGPDQRFVVRSEEIKKITNGLTNAAWLFLDIKSVGPRDDADHAVMSHNQISGDGRWETPEAGVSNTLMTAQGRTASHLFHPSIPPLYVLSDGTIAPVVLSALKPVYRMLSLEHGSLKGQPLGRLALITIPNGLLLEVSPGYLAQYPGLLFPGKDDKGKDPRKLRARICFQRLRTIANWRVQTIWDHSKQK
jgi:hypothetical protein